MHHFSPAAGQRFQLERMIFGLSTGIITLETDGSLRYVNRAALELHHVTNAEALGRSSAAYREHFRLIDLTGVPLSGSVYPLERFAKLLHRVALPVFLLDRHKIAYRTPRPLDEERLAGREQTRGFIPKFSNTDFSHGARLK